MDANPLDTLKWLAEIGDDTPLADAPIDRFAESAEQAKIRASAGAAASAEKRPSLRERAAKVQDSLPPQDTVRSSLGGPPSLQRSAATLPDAEAVASARELAAEANTLEALKKTLGAFEGCNLRLTAKNLVFADGNPQARVMLIGEAPGRDEDIQGLPFVGRSGQLLDRMLAAIGLDRTDVYITNVLPWRPPGNRTPTPAEVEICRPFLEKHIALAGPAGKGPDMLVAIGGSAAKMLFQTSDGIMSVRGKWRELTIGERQVHALATLHPAYLLRQPAQKKLAWQDLLQIKRRLAENMHENS